MAAPTYATAGTGATDAGGVWSFDWGALGVNTSQVFVIQILQDGSTDGAVGWTAGVACKNLAGTSSAVTQIVGPNGDGSWPVGASSEARQFLLIGRPAGIVGPAISGTNSTSEDLYARCYIFSNVSTGTTLATVIENSTAGNATNGTGTSNTASDTAVTTLGPDRLALNFVAVNDDNAISAFTGETGGDWTLAVAPYADAGGTDGAIGLQIAYPSDFQNSAARIGSSILNGAAGGNDRLAQSFTTSGAITLTHATLMLLKTGTPVDNVVVEIQTDSGGNPSGTVVGTGGTVAGADIATGTVFSQHLVGINATLSAGTTYWIVLSRSGAGDAANDFRWGSTASDSDFTGGTGKTRATTGGAWSATSRDFVFSLSSGATGTIDGGTENHVDSDAWGVVGFALIGTTPSYQPRDAETFHDLR